MATVVVGRRAERDAVAALLDAVPSGAGALVLDGEAGIGKTTIWLQAIDGARDRGYSVLACRPAEAEAALPFVSLGDLFDPVLDRLPSALSPSQRTVLETALARIEPTEAFGRLAVSRASLGLVRELAREEAVLIAIDDVQWLDPASSSVLEFVARRVVDLPVSFLVTRRSAREATPPLGLARAFERKRLVVFQVGPLPVGDLDRLLRASLDLCLPRPRLLELSRISGGNPLYALEIARVAAHDPGSPETVALSVPESLGALLRARLETLSAEANDAILLAAAASHPTAGLIERAAEHAEGLCQALHRAILALDGPRLRFAHPLLASVAYEAAFPWQRREAHRRLAMAADEPEERARHLALGTEGPSEATACELDRAARLATARGAPEAAAQLAEHAARLTPSELEDERRRRLTEAAEYHVASGDPARGRSILESLIERLDPGPTRAGLLWRLADAVGDDLGTSIRLCEQALAETGGDAGIEAQIHTALGVFTWLAGDLERATDHCRASADCAERTGDKLLVAVSLGELCHAETVLGRRHRDEDMERALELEQDLAAFPANVRPSFQLGVILMYTDDLDGARPLLRAELERSQASGDEAARFGVLFRLAELELRAGNWADAARHADDALTSALQAGIEQEQSVVLMVHALVRAHLGDLDIAQDAAERALAIAEAGGDRIVATRSRGVLGFLELSRGDPAAALEHLGPAGHELRALGIGELSISGVVQNEIEALISLGRLDEAEEALDWVEERGRPTSRAWHAAVAARGRALVAAARGDADAADAAIRSALQAHERLPQPFELGRTLLVQGQIERRLKRRGAARRALTGALDLFDSLGAPLWAEKAAEELARIPGRTPGSGDLTETERRVAELVAEGLSNKEVAGALFVSVRTVEANLSKAFVKLGVHSRTELLVRLGRPSSQ